MIYLAVAIVLFAALALGTARTLWKQRRELREFRRRFESPEARITDLPPSALAPRYIAAPDEEITEPVHVMLSPHEMACGAPYGIGVFSFEADRVTCEMCKEWQRENRGIG